MRLELAGIRAGYGDTVVLRDLDLVVPEGKVVALLGPNGAGKSTTLGVASGLLRPSRGSVLMDDLDVTASSALQRVQAGLCHVTEVGAVYPSLTVAENLRLFGDPGSSQEATNRALEAFPRLGERVRQAAGTLSGGEQRMLALARAYIRQPSTVLLDEVSLGLAPIVVDEIFEFFRQLAAGGTSLLVVEQYVGKVLELADIVYVLVRGQVVFAGEPDELRDTDLLGTYFGAETAGPG